MSSPQAIAAVTSILTQAVKDALPAYAGLPKFVTAGPPHSTRDGRDDPQVNLFLYQISPDAAWRNQDVPGKPGAAYPLLALRLNYLVTAFGQDQDDGQAHGLLGAVMQRFHADPVPARSGAARLIADSELGKQFEPIRITLQPLTLDDLSKIWAGSPSPYRLSVGYEVSVVLIDSGKPARAAPPVLGRAGENDTGFVAGTLGDEPALEGLRFPMGLPGIRLGDVPAGQTWLPDELNLSGHGLDHTALRLVFRHMQLGFGIIATPLGGRTPASLRARLPKGVRAYRELPDRPLDEIETAANLIPAADLSAWPPGVYTVSAARAVSSRKNQPPDRLFTTAPLAFGLLPAIDTTGAPFDLVFSAPPAAPSAKLGVALLTPLQMTGGKPAQKVRLFAGSLELLGVVTTADGLVLSWKADDPARLRRDLDAAKNRGETLYLRVQVDGVDSSLMKPPADGTPTRQFDEKLIVRDNP